MAIVTEFMIDWQTEDVTVPDSEDVVWQDVVNETEDTFGLHIGQGLELRNVRLTGDIAEVTFTADVPTAVRFLFAYENGVEAPVLNRDITVYQLMLVGFDEVYFTGGVRFYRVEDVKPGDRDGYEVLELRDGSVLYKA